MRSVRICEGESVHGSLTYNLWITQVILSVVLSQGYDCCLNYFTSSFEERIAAIGDRKTVAKFCGEMMH